MIQLSIRDDKIHGISLVAKLFDKNNKVIHTCSIGLPEELHNLPFSSPKLKLQRDRIINHLIEKRQK